MRKMDWESADAEPPTEQAQTTPACSSDGSRALRRQSTAAPPSALADLKFVNMSHPEDIRRQKEVRTEIRRHVMKGIGQQRRRPRPTKTSPRARRTSSREVDDDELSQLHDTDINNTSPGRTLATLGSFPIEADMRVLELIHFAETAPYQPFRSVWIEVALCDPGAFHVTLGNAADLLRKINGDNSPIKSPEVLSHYAVSVMQLRRRLNCVAESISEGAIANILAHVCLTMRHYDWDSWRVHMDGLSLISKLRGGFANLGHHIPILILLYDLAGAMVFDSYPRFSLPTDVLGTPRRSLRGVPSRLQALLIQLEQMPPEVAPAGEALRLISSIADVINTNSHSASFWKRDIDAITLMGPCIHFLLSMPRLSNNFETKANSQDLIAREMVRLVCLMLMSRLKEMFAFFASEKVALQARLARFLSQNAKRLGKRYFELKIWALVTASMLQHRDGRGVYIHEIRRELRAMDNPTPYDVVEIAREVVWIDILMSPFADELAEDMTLCVFPR
ncbi:hypothetical protein V1505DRAFT_381774 [Lipomyces doorenjongii]